MYSKASYELSVIRSTLVYWPASNKNIFMFDLCSPLWCAFLFTTLSWHSSFLRLSARENQRILLQHYCCFAIFRCVCFRLSEFPLFDLAIGIDFVVARNTGTTKRAPNLIPRTQFQDSFKPWTHILYCLYSTVLKSVFWRSRLVDIYRSMSATITDSLIVSFIQRKFATNLNQV